MLVICFSKDRPLQLKAYIDSLKKYYAFSDCIINILYTMSSDIYANSYTNLAETYKDIFFIKETDFKEQLKSIVYNSNEEYILFGCDDVLFISNFSNEYKYIFQNENIFCFSLRLGINIKYCQPANLYEKFEGDILNNKFLIWNWTTASGFEFHYPFEVSASIYRRIDVIKYFQFIDKYLPQWHPNLIENKFYNPDNIKNFIERPLMSSYINPKSVSLVINRVQSKALNRTYHEYSTEHLLKLFEEGREMDLDFYTNKIYDRVHIGEFRLKIPENLKFKTDLNLLPESVQEEILSITENKNVKIIETVTEYKVLIKNDKHIYSSHNVEYEIKKYISGFKISEENIVILVGFGLGYHLMEIVNNYKFKKIFILEYNYDILKLAFEINDFNDLLKKKNIFFLDGINENNLIKNILQEIPEQDFKNTLILKVNSLINFEKDKFNRTIVILNEIFKLDSKKVEAIEN